MRCFSSFVEIINLMEPMETNNRWGVVINLWYERRKIRLTCNPRKKSETFRLITGQNHGHGELPSVHSFTPMITRSSQDIFRIIASAIQKRKYAETTLNTCTAGILNSSEIPGRPKPSPPREKRSSGFPCL